MKPSDTVKGRGQSLAGTGRQASPCMNKRAQIWSFDFMASVVVFFMILTVLFFTWEYTTIQNEDQLIFNDMENNALTITDSMIRTRGFPEYWNDSNVQVLGLASEENVLNETKILMFVQMDYDSSRRVLGIPAYEFYFQVLHLNDTQAQANGTDLVQGLDPLLFQNSTIVIPIERYILFDSRVAKLRFILWR
jgi:hypothetical protein